MCGIGGYYRTGNTNKNAPKWAKPALRKLWDSLQRRGSDASGIAYESPTGIRHYKKDIPAYELSGLATGLAFSMNRPPHWVMLHTRAATHGKPEYNKNNHPVMGYNLALCHNGVVYNKDEVLKRYNLVAQRGVDTEAILVSLKKGGIDAVAKHVKGSMSISWAKGQTMYLWTNGASPLVIGELYNGDYIYASTDDHLMTTGLRFRNVFDAKAGYLYKFTPNGMTTQKTYFRKHVQTVSWRDLSGFTPVKPKKKHTKKVRQVKLSIPKRVRYPELKPTIDYSMPEKHTQYDEWQQELQAEYDWESVYGDWRKWEKKSKEIKQ